MVFTATYKGFLDRHGLKKLAMERTRFRSGSAYYNQGRARLISSGTNVNLSGPKKNLLSIWHLAQVFVIVVVMYFVYDANANVQEAARRLEHYRQEKAVLVHQMDQMEDRAKHLREELTRLRNDFANANDESIHATTSDSQDILKEMQQSKLEYFDVNKEVHAIQNFMKINAMKDLQQKYGTGAIQLNLDLDFGEESVSSIFIELFEEAPHAAWVFAQQIENGDWSLASFIWHPAHMVLAASNKISSVNLEFVEKTYHHHEAWTIGLTKSMNGGYNLYINLQENSHVHEGDVCIGKVIGGFDTLHKLKLRDKVAKSSGAEMAYLDPPVPISQVTISTKSKEMKA